MLKTLIILALHLRFVHGSEQEERVSRQGNNLSKRSTSKSEKMKRFLKKIEANTQTPVDFKPEAWCRPHNPDGPAVISAAIGPYMRYNIETFAGTARRSGYTSDLVIGYSSDRPGFIRGLHEFDTIAYLMSLECNGKKSHALRCHLKGQKLSLSINMLRFYIYIYWARMYNSNAILMITDFRDVVFQSNPFEYNIRDWMPPSAQFVTFQEAFPNKAIYRCTYNSAWIKKCYGEASYNKVSSYTVACSGVSLGTAEAMIVYVSFQISCGSIRNTMHLFIFK